MKWPWIVSGNRHRRLLKKYREMKKLNAELLNTINNPFLPDADSPEAADLLNDTGTLDSKKLRAIFRRDTHQPIRKVG
jgi:hypothetical protein